MRCTYDMSSEGEWQTIRYKTKGVECHRPRKPIERNACRDFCCSKSFRANSQARKWSLTLYSVFSIVSVLDRTLRFSIVPGRSFNVKPLPRSWIAWTLITLTNSCFLFSSETFNSSNIWGVLGSLRAHCYKHLLSSPTLSGMFVFCIFIWHWFAPPSP